MPKYKIMYECEHCHTMRKVYKFIGEMTELEKEEFKKACLCYQIENLQEEIKSLYMNRKPEPEPAPEPKKPPENTHCRICNNLLGVGESGICYGCFCNKMLQNNDKIFKNIFGFFQ